MRKIKFVTHGYFGGRNSDAPGPIKEGWFHGFYQESNNDGGINPVAVVETLIGECISLGVNQIKFELQPDERQGGGRHFIQHRRANRTIAPKTEVETKKILDMISKQTSYYYQNNPYIKCVCGRTGELLYFYHCYFCGLYFCPACSEKHFGKRPEGIITRTIKERMLEE